ncbi:MAG: 6-phosphogluconolactonase [Pseudomonadales bacterium]
MRQRKQRQLAMGTSGGYRVTDRAECTVLPDGESLAGSVAAWLLERVLAHPGRVSICLAGGSTLLRLYQVLAQEPFCEQMPWHRIHWFWTDERFVPANDARSNSRMVREAMLDRVRSPAGSVHPISTDGLSLDAAVVAYERGLKTFYGADELIADRPLFDVTLLGLGADGRIASLLPGTSVLEERSRWVAAVVGPVPEARITLTYPALESSRNVAFLVTGASKRGVLARARNGAQDIPAARLRPIGRLHWFADRAAAIGFA